MPAKGRSKRISRTQIAVVCITASEKLVVVQHTTNDGAIRYHAVQGQAELNEDGNAAAVDEVLKGYQDRFAFAEYQISSSGDSEVLQCGSMDDGTVVMLLTQCSFSRRTFPTTRSVKPGPAVLMEVPLSVLDDKKVAKGQALALGMQTARTNGYLPE
jgi:hypothetical protein